MTAVTSHTIRRLSIWLSTFLTGRFRTCSCKRVAATPDAQARSAHPAPDDAGPVWLTWAQVGERAKAIAAGLTRLGVGREDRVAILANTRLEWVLADLGIMCAGAATTTVYPTTEPEDAAFIVADSGSKVLIAENAGAGRQDRRRATCPA